MVAFLKNRKFMLGISFFIFIVFNLIVLNRVSLINIQKKLISKNSIIFNEITYDEGNWDIQSFIQDQTVERQQPLNLITSQGFVIERSSLINGFLDNSDYHFASSFPIPQLITTPTGNNWLMFSRYITNNSETFGVLTIGYPNPTLNQMEEVSRLLVSSANSLLDKIKIKQGQIDLTDWNSNYINNQISFQVIGNDERIRFSRGNLPSYLDRSRVAGLMKQRFISTSDINNGNKYLLAAMPLIFDGQDKGVVISGIPLKTVTQNNLITFVILFFSSVLLFIFLNYLIRKSEKFTVKTSNIKFNDLQHCIIYNGKSLSLPFDTNQYYLAKLLINHKHKRYEVDELAEIIFGSTDFSQIAKYWRQLYDSARLLNEKFRKKYGKNLIVCSAKTFIINQELVTQIDST